MFVIPWKIELLGRFRASRNDQVIDRFSTHKTAAILARLAYVAPRLVPREELAEMFWGEEEPERGRQNLRQSLTVLRHILESPADPGQSVVIANRQDVGLNPGAVGTDVAEFRRAVYLASKTSTDAEKSDCLKRGLALYQGEFLPGFYEDWVFPERRALDETYRESLRQLVNLKRLSGEFEEGLQLVNSWISVAPDDDEPVVAAMHLCAAAGRPAAGLRYYQNLARTLKTEFTAEPLPETQALSKKLQAELLNSVHTSTTLPICSKSSDYPAPPVARSAQSPECDVTAAIPVPLTRFFGRQNEIEKLTALLAPAQQEAESFDSSSRLVTLVGMTGSGKTRLAIEVGRRLAAKYQGAVWFVQLADTSQHPLIMERILAAIPGGDLDSGNALQRLKARVGDKPGLLILDNFEQLLSDGVDGNAEGAKVVQEMLEQVSQLSVLLTSQRALGVYGEQEVEILPLSVPAPDDTLETVASSASIQLFIDRARNKRPDFGLTDHNKKSIVLVCDHLDGIPLALELAAAWSKVLAPAQIEEQLRIDSSFLRDESKGRLPRHRSLREALEWSYRLLPEPSRRFLADLSVFRGGWTIHALNAIAETTDALGLLQQLGDRSFVISNPTMTPRRPKVESEGSASQIGPRNVMRFTMVETIRSFAWEKLAAERREEIVARHAGYYTTLALNAEPSFLGPSPETAFDEIDADNDNFRAALERLEQRGSIDDTLRLMAVLTRFWYVRGYAWEGRRRLEALLAKGGGGLQAIAKAYNGLGTLAYSMGDYDASRAAHQESLANYRKLGDTQTIGYVLNDIGLTYHAQCYHAEAKVLYEESLGYMRSGQDEEGIALTLNNLAGIASDHGDFAIALEHLQEALNIRRKLKQTDGIACLLRNMGNVAHRQADLLLANTYFEESLDYAREMGDLPGIMGCQNNLAMIACRQDSLLLAQEYANQALDLARQLGDDYGEGSAWHALGFFHLKRRDGQAAADCLGKTLAIRNRANDRGRIAECLEAFAQLWHLAGNPTEAVILCGAADQVRLDIPMPLPPVARMEHGEVLKCLRACMSQEDFTRAWEKGKSLSLERAVQHALQVRNTDGLRSVRNPG